MQVRQGEVYHLVLPPPLGSEPGHNHFAVVVQHDSRNKSNFNTAVVCLLTEALSQGRHQGNVTLRPGEARLREQSVVNVSQMLTLDKRVYLGDFVGNVDPETMPKILAGIRELLEGRKTDYR